MTGGKGGGELFRKGKKQGEEGGKILPSQRDQSAMLQMREREIAAGETERQKKFLANGVESSLVEIRHAVYRRRREETVFDINGGGKPEARAKEEGKLLGGSHN